MRVIVKTQPEVTFVKIEVSRVDSIFLNIHSFVYQKLLQTIVNFSFLKQLFEFLLKMHHIISLEFDAKIR